jgi:hypothetical protein
MAESKTKICSTCKAEKSEASYSKTQWWLSAGKRKCRSCAEKSGPAPKVNSSNLTVNKPGCSCKTKIELPVEFHQTIANVQVSGCFCTKDLTSAQNKGAIAYAVVEALATEYKLSPQEQQLIADCFDIVELHSSEDKIDPSTAIEEFVTKWQGKAVLKARSTAQPFLLNYWKAEVSTICEILNGEFDDEDDRNSTDIKDLITADKKQEATEADNSEKQTKAVVESALQIKDQSDVIKQLKYAIQALQEHSSRLQQQNLALARVIKLEERPYLHLGILADTYVCQLQPVKDFMSENSIFSTGFAAISYAMKRERVMKRLEAAFGSDKSSLKRAIQLTQALRNRRNFAAHALPTSPDEAAQLIGSGYSRLPAYLQKLVKEAFLHLYKKDLETLLFPTK